MVSIFKNPPDLSYSKPILTCAYSTESKPETNSVFQDKRHR